MILIRCVVNHSALQVYTVSQKFGRQELQNAVYQFASSHLELFMSITGMDVNLATAFVQQVEVFRQPYLNAIPLSTTVKFSDIVKTPWLASWMLHTPSPVDPDGYTTEDDEDSEVCRIYNVTVSTQQSPSATDGSCKDGSNKMWPVLTNSVRSPARPNRSSLPKFVSHACVRIGGNKFIALGGGFRLVITANGWTERISFAVMQAHGLYEV
jgi:hypothetical protein